MKPKVTIAYVYNESFSATIPCLQHLIEKTPPGTYELICVDAGAPESIAKQLRKMAEEHDFTLIRSDTFLSHNHSRNLALRQVKTPYVVFVDNDVEVGEGWLEPLVNCADETGAWLVSPLLMQSIQGKLSVHMYGGTYGFKDENGVPKYWQEHIAQHADLETIEVLARHETPLIEFHVLLMNMTVYHTLGEFDEGFLNHTQHMDLCQAVSDAHKKIFIEPLSIITHLRPEGRLEAIDKDFYSARWGENSSNKTLERISEKYNIPVDDPSLEMLRWWISFHRQVCMVQFPIIKKLFGKKIHNLIRKYIGSPIEKRMNARKYQVFGTIDCQVENSRIINQ
jgi:GT2 family glycosyltransferase